MKCKFEDKPCQDRYWGNRGSGCRLAEWKKRRKVCQYDSNITSLKAKIVKGQTKLVA